MSAAWVVQAAHTGNTDLVEYAASQNPRHPSWVQDITEAFTWPSQDAATFALNLMKPHVKNLTLTATEKLA